ncbi:3-isopropylmalate dehydratase small subunit [Paraburkholderia fungorum]|uniref:3-isopropylmalate dehydratase n=1 Tax=Paraburkholderia fungorum TaxID=134537 RepID=A0A3R7F3F1_9BURK|nr:3-isopropylmalate dehydratase small subunit [Paraburkholderia fungorum]RKF33358.1 3-isopropylmalate dehydratase small subunit [Paraburkholderia fungorum]
MKPFTTVTGAAVPLPLANIDTDVIIRVERMTNRSPSAMRKYAFEALRYLGDGSENPDSPFNQEIYRDAPILLTGDNFGCGSSREPAVWAIASLGVRCVIAESFGDIFFSNCFQNGLLALVLPPAEIALLASEANGSANFKVDLTQQIVTSPSGTVYPFDVDPIRKELLLEGLDEIGQTLKWSDAITAWQTADRIARPWVWQSPIARMPKD